MRKPCSLPVLRWLQQATREAPPFSAALCECLCAAAPGLLWRQTYTVREAEPAFLERYGWCELIGPTGMMLSERLACGLLLLGPETLYPSHRHEAEELYISLSGSADWHQSDRGWVRQPPGAVIHHASFEPHAMRSRCWHCISGAAPNCASRHGSMPKIIPATITFFRCSGALFP
jgi:hypothetical protein